jgi:hypothetical protein
VGTNQVSFTIPSSNSTGTGLSNGYYAVGSPGTLTVINTLDDGAGSLRNAIVLANSNPDPSIIKFNIPTGAGPAVITLLTALPAVTTLVTIDGTSQPDYSANNESTQVVVSDNTTSPIGKGLLMSGSSQGSQVKGLILSGFSNYGLNVQVDNITVQAVKVK